MISTAKKTTLLPVLLTLVLLAGCKDLWHSPEEKKEEGPPEDKNPPAQTVNPFLGTWYGTWEDDDGEMTYDTITFFENPERWELISEWQNYDTETYTGFYDVHGQMATLDGRFPGNAEIKNNGVLSIRWEGIAFAVEYTKTPHNGPPTNNPPPPAANPFLGKWIGADWTYNTFEEFTFYANYTWKALITYLDDDEVIECSGTYTVSGNTATLKGNLDDFYDLDTLVAVLANSSSFTIVWDSTSTVVYHKD